ncbi:MAG TPA: ATP-binding protein, partial [Gemmatimonadaceae bacterium]|nr:ATP-binding protein [Gemmatimonadaceae bacterium]
DLAAGVMAEIRLRAQLAARERMQAQLVEATREAERANHAKSDFLNRMSHELRTPLNSIIGFANLILQRGGSRPASERTYIERIRDNGMHLLGLINEVLDIARVESGHLEITLGIVDVGALVRGVIAQLESRVAGTPVSLRAEVPEDMRAITSDEVRLRQVLINLVGNALKFTQEGSVTVRVTADAQGTPCTIAVVDTGIGIPAERLQAIFEPFEQADASTSVRFGGTGLGLAISRDLCRLMGCALHVESVVGRGSTFTIELPERPPRP